jgi:hypothetical protein
MGIVLADRIQQKLFYTEISVNRQFDKVTANPRIGHEGPETEWKYNSTVSLTLMLERCEWSSLRPGHLILGKRPGTHCIGSRVGPRAGLEGAENLALHRNSIPEPSSM